MIRADRRARVDLAALQVQLPPHRRVVSPASGRRMPRRRRRSPSSRRTRTATAPGRWPARSRTPAPICWPAPTSRKARRCGRPASARRSWSSARLSVSDLDGLFDCRLTPTISTPGAARAVQAAAARYRQRLRYHLKIDTGMNRLGFRFDNLRRTLPELLASENLELDAVYTHFATADDPELAAVRPAARPVRRSALARYRGARRRGPRYRPRRATAPRCCAIRASGSIACGPACCCTASCRRRWPRRSTLDAGDDARQPRRGGEGHARRRSRAATARASPPSGRRRSRSSRPATPTASTCGWRAAAPC